MIPGVTPRTWEKLEHNGKCVRIGDRETGIWEVPDTHWYKYGDRFVFLVEGTRLEATFGFQVDEESDRGYWQLVDIDIENLAPPTSIEHPVQQKRRRWGRLVLSAAVTAALLMWLLDI